MLTNALCLDYDRLTRRAKVLFAQRTQRRLARRLSSTLTQPLLSGLSEDGGDSAAGAAGTAERGLAPGGRAGGGAAGAGAGRRQQQTEGRAPEEGGAQAEGNISASGDAGTPQASQLPSPFSYG